MTETGTVTLLFTDLAGSTELLGRLGDDAAEELRRTHFGLLREAASAHEGHEVKNLGDGLMVAFPSALAGVACAAAMQRLVERHNRQHPDRPLGLRVGVNAGEAISEREDYFGTPVVVAKRLCDRAEAGQVLVSQLVRGLVGTRGGYRFRDLGVLALKGLADPVPACELAWAPDAGERSGTRAARQPDSLAPPEPGPSAAARTALATIPLPLGLNGERAGTFVGRDRALAFLAEHFEQASAGRRQLVLLAGEPGIGKTWLASALARRAQGEGALVLYGRCEEEAMVPYQPFVEALEHYVSHCPEADLRAQVTEGGAELARLLPALRRRLPGLPEPTRGDPASERYRLFEAIAALLAAIARRAPALLVLDDLHWADKPTLALIKHIMRSPERAPLLIVGTYRDVELGRAHPLAGTLADLRRDRLFERLRLDGLSEAEVGAMIAAWAGEALPAQLTRAIWEETEGHPFFVQEVLRNLLEAGRILAGEARLASGQPSVERLGIPEGVREAIESRLGRLDQATQRVLSVAAVIGREFGVEILERVSEASGEGLFVLLEEAAAARVISEVPGAEASYAFSHALIRETLYEDLTAPHRVRLHQRIGRALEELPESDREARLAELAHHYFEAATGSDVLTKAIEYAAEAGGRAAAQLAYEDAAAHYERAARALAFKGSDERRRCELLLALGESRWSGGEFKLAREAFREAGGIAERLGLAEELARAALGFGGGSGFEVGVTNPALLALLERSLALLADEDSALRARVMARLAEALAFSPQRGRAPGLAERAVEMARGLGDKGVLAEVLAKAMWARANPDNVEEQLATAFEIERLGEEVGSTTLLLDAIVLRFTASFERGDVEAARATREAGRRLAEQIRQPYYLWFAAVSEAALAFIDQPLTEVERLIGRAIEVGRETQNPIALELFGTQICFLRLYQGRGAEMRAGTEGMVESLPHFLAYRCGLAWLYCELGMEAAARRELERLAVNDFGDLPRDLAWLSGTELLADVCAHLGDQARAATLYELLAPYEDHYIVVAWGAVPRGSVARQLGVLAAGMSRYEEAERHFESALERDRETGSPYALAKSRCDYASMLLGRNGEGDRERAFELLDEALEVGERLGAAGIAERARALRRGAIGEPGGPQRGREPLPERAARARSRARAAASSRGRSALARLVGEASDEELERRFGSALAQRALFAGIARSFQASFAFGFEGEIGLELIHPADRGGTPASEWWTIRVEGTKAVAGHRAASDPAVTLRMSVPTFIRILSGEDNPVGAQLEDRIQAKGDLVLGSRLVEMFGGVNPSDILAPV